MKKTAALLGLLLLLTSCARNVPAVMPQTQQPTAAATTEQQPTEPYITSTVTVGAAGDLLMHTPLLETAEALGGGEYDFSYIFPYVSPVIEGCDYFIANLEVTLGGEERGYSSYPLFNCPDSIVDAAKNAGIDCLLTANNHSYDTFDEGLIRTQEVIKQSGLDYTGTVTDLSDKRYLVKEVGGISFGFICYTFETETDYEDRKGINGITMSAEMSPYINSFDYNDLEAFYEDFRTQTGLMKADGAEVVTAFLHWGTEYDLKPGYYQTEMAQTLCDLGADVIIGGHPHVVQPAASLTSSDGSHTALCLYSMGNFVSNQQRQYMDLSTGHTEDGCIIETTFSKYSDGTVTFDGVRYIPTWVHSYYEDGAAMYNIVPLEGDPAENAEALGLDRSADGVANARESRARTLALVAPEEP